jgi:hypothetical protein
LKLEVIGAVPRAFGMIEQIEEAMLTIRFIEMDDQDAYMLKKSSPTIRLQIRWRVTIFICLTRTNGCW